MQLETLVATSDRVRRRGKRLDKLAALVELLSLLDPSDTELAVAFLSGELPFGRIGVGYSTVRQALPDEAPPPSSTLTLTDVEQAFRKISEIGGSGSKQRRLEQLRELLRKATAEERDFLGRLLLGELRQGALEGIMVDALARATGIPLSQIRRAAMLTGDLQRVAVAALNEGEEALKLLRVQLFQPLQAMLAQPSGSLREAGWRVLGTRAPSEGESLPSHAWRELALELKIDGARVQVHRQAEVVRVYSRRLNEVSESVPEIVERVLDLPCEEVILDGEAYVQRPDGSPQPFQVTMRRFGRKLEVERLRDKLPLDMRFFDCLFLDGEELIDHPLEQRRERMETLLEESLRIPSLLPTSEAEAQRFLNGALDSGHEGVMVKALSSSYEAGRRGTSWLKVKPSHTLDLVVLAVEWGSGRRRGKLSNLHLGARDPESGGFVMLGKTFKGLTDKMLAWQTERLLELETSRDGHVVHVRPELVVEIACNNVQASPQYPAGMALRFARVKQYRTDKSAEQASSLDEVRAIFERDHFANSSDPAGESPESAS